MCVGWGGGGALPNTMLEEGWVVGRGSGQAGERGDGVLRRGGSQAPGGTAGVR